MDNTTVRFGIVLTYRCNASCEGCNRFLDVAPWSNSDIYLEDLEEGYNRVVQSGLKIDKVRVSGGEPILHPQFSEAMLIIGRTWNGGYGGRTCVFSNGIKKPPKADGWRYRVAAVDKKPEHFHPPMISPSDLGLEPNNGIKNECRRQVGCGRLFDAFGFSFCVFAGAIGRLLGIDPYSPAPVLQGCDSICRHCPFSQGIKGAFRLFEAANNNKIEYPTKTYQRALKKCQSRDVIEFKRFAER